MDVYFAFATIALGFFALIAALVAVAIAIAYRQTDIAQEAVKNSGKLFMTENVQRSKPNKDDKKQ